MTLVPFRTGDIAPFLNLAAEEGWVAEPWEFEFLLSEFPRGCFTARGENGEAAGFVTSLRHKRSGWIGNLIVSSLHRGNGIGALLFKAAKDALQESGIETIWLTASKSGRSLYEKHGFSTLDTIIRWTCQGSGGGRASAGRQIGAESSLAASGIDYLAWGDRRDSLLSAVSRRGRVLLEESGFTVIQPCGTAMQLGPFAALNGATAKRILNDALQSIPPETRLYIDAPASNIAARKLYCSTAMRISGSTELMYAGKKPAYLPELLYGLASMGSMG